MIKKIVDFIRRLFGQSDNVTYGKNRRPSHVHKKPVNSSHKINGNHQSKNISNKSSDKHNIRHNNSGKDNKKVSDVKHPIKKVVSNNQKTSSNSTSFNKPIYHAPRQASPMINKAVLMRKIKTNIFFLEQLLQMLEGQPSYKSYYRKVREMKEQSESCFKLVHRMKEEAPYFNNTLKTVLEHTNTVAELLDIK